MTMRRLFRTLYAPITIAALANLLGACATSPEGRKQLIFVPDAQMDTMGAQAFDEMKAKQPVERDAATNNYVRCVSNAITNALPEQRTWEVVVFRDDSANAFALPGGKIGVHTGLLKVATTPSQLAAVIGHEVGHVLAKHGAERVSEQFAMAGGLELIGNILASGDKQSQNYQLLMGALGAGAQFGVVLPHGRTQEKEADIIGLDLMAKAGFDPEQSVVLWENMGKAGGGQPPEFLSTHPSHGTRIENLRSHMVEAKSYYAQASSRPSCSR